MLSLWLCRTICLTYFNAAVTDLECLNCWNAIRAVSAGRHYIARVEGQPINTVRNTNLSYMNTLVFVMVFLVIATYLYMCISVLRSYSYVQ